MGRGACPIVPVGSIAICWDDALCAPKQATSSGARCTHFDSPTSIDVSAAGRASQRLSPCDSLMWHSASRSSQLAPRSRSKRGHRASRFLAPRAGRTSGAAAIPVGFFLVLPFGYSALDSKETNPIPMMLGSCHRRHVWSRIGCAHGRNGRRAARTHSRRRRRNPRGLGRDPRRDAARLEDPVRQSRTPRRYRPLRFSPRSHYPRSVPRSPTTVRAADNSA